MTLKQLWLGFSILMALSMSAVATAKPIVYTQTKQKTQIITKLPYEGRSVNKRFQFDITNGTTIPWTDYTFVLLNTTMKGVPKYKVSVSYLDIMAGGFTKTKIYENDGISYDDRHRAVFDVYDGLIKPNDMFTIKLFIAYSGPVNIYGAPSVGAPEPPGLVLFGFGFVALIVLKRAVRA